MGVKGSRQSAGEQFCVIFTKHAAAQESQKRSKSWPECGSELAEVRNKLV